MPHTPGPWTVQQRYDGATTVAIMRSRRTLSVEAAKQWITDEHGRVKTEAELEVESEANANVMAASPDLLSSLKEIQERAALPFGTVTSASDWGAMWQRARAAIAKADGR